MLVNSYIYSRGYLVNGLVICKPTIKDGAAEGFPFVLPCIYDCFVHHLCLDLRIIGKISQPGKYFIQHASYLSCKNTRIPGESCLTDTDCLIDYSLT